MQLLIQPWICALGTHYDWVDRGSVEYEVCPTLLRMASTENRTPDLLILSNALSTWPHAPIQHKEILGCGSFNDQAMTSTQSPARYKLVTYLDLNLSAQLHIKSKCWLFELYHTEMFYFSVDVWISYLLPILLYMAGVGFLLDQFVLFV